MCTEYVNRYATVVDPVRLQIFDAGTMLNFYSIYEKLGDVNKTILEQTYINPLLGKEKPEYLQGNYEWTDPNILPQPHLALVFAVGFYERSVLL